MLLAGPSGTGKTMSASVIAHETGLPLYVVRMENVVTKFMGETSLKLGKVFDIIRDLRGVYLFDEFDAIGLERGREYDVAEMRRVLGSFLQMMERDTSESLILAATNDMRSLDKALYHRFDDLLEFSLPSDTEKLELLKRRLFSFDVQGDMSALLCDMKDMSHAEVCMICTDAAKEVILSGKAMSVALLKEVILSRLKAYQVS